MWTRTTNYANYELGTLPIELLLRCIVGAVGVEPTKTSDSKSLRYTNSLRTHKMAPPA